MNCWCALDTSLCEQFDKLLGNIYSQDCVLVLTHVTLKQAFFVVLRMIARTFWLSSGHTRVDK